MAHSRRFEQQLGCCCISDYCHGHSELLGLRLYERFVIRVAEEWTAFDVFFSETGGVFGWEERKEVRGVLECLK